MNKGIFVMVEKWSDRKLMKSVNGKELSKILKLNNCKPGKSYEVETYLDDIYFSANKGKIQRLSKIKDVKPNEFGVIEFEFYKTNIQNEENKILSCNLNGLVSVLSRTQKEFDEAQKVVKEFFDAAEEIIKMYFGGDE